MLKMKFFMGALLCLLAARDAGLAKSLHQHCDASNSSRRSLVVAKCHQTGHARVRLIDPFETEWDVEKWEKALRAGANRN